MEEVEKFAAEIKREYDAAHAEGRDPREGCVNANGDTYRWAEVSANKRVFDDAAKSYPIGTWLIVDHEKILATGKDDDQVWDAVGDVKLSPNLLYGKVGEEPDNLCPRVSYMANA